MCDARCGATVRHTHLLRDAVLVELLVQVEARLEDMEHLVRALVREADLQPAVGARDTREPHQPLRVERDLDNAGKVAVALEVVELSVVGGDPTRYQSAQSEPTWDAFVCRRGTRARTVPSAHGRRQAGVGNPLVRVPLLCTLSTSSPETWLATMSYRNDLSSPMTPGAPSRPLSPLRSSPISSLQNATSAAESQRPTSTLSQMRSNMRTEISSCS